MRGKQDHRNWTRQVEKSVDQGKRGNLQGEGEKRQNRHVTNDRKNEARTTTENGTRGKKQEARPIDKNLNIESEKGTKSSNM
jgi:hypothetical protein